MKRALIVILAAALLAACGRAKISETGGYRSERLSPALASFIDEASRMSIETMTRNRIPGLSIVFVDEHGALWEDGFGFADDAGDNPVTPNTRFSIQSMSKTFTAVAVLAAVRDGLLELDAPITRYIPDFTVHSLFEERPQDRITLRHLLTHTSGLAHEAPLGNNYTPDEPSFDDHVASISDTWLRFRVGEREEYSNLGVDMAAYILQTVRARPFPEAMRDTVLGPLGMIRSTTDRAAVEADTARAHGHKKGVTKFRTMLPMLGAGGVWSTAHDMGIFVRFMLLEGAEGGILPNELFTQLVTTANGGQYGLGVAFGRLPSGDLYLAHGGGGFGFLSYMAWYPTYGIGIAVLTNSADHDNAQASLAQKIVSTMADRGLITKKRSLTGEPVAQIDVRGAGDLSWYVAGHPDAAAWKDGWSRFLGVYGPLYDSENLSREFSVRIARKGNGVTADGVAMFEAEPGLFFMLDGRTVDFRGEMSLFANTPMRRK